MNEKDFRNFMKKQRRSQGTMDSCVEFTKVFEEYLSIYYDNIPLSDAHSEHLDTFLDWGKKEIGSMNSYLWAISRYYEYMGIDEMRRYANQLRGKAIAKKRAKRLNLLLEKIQGVSRAHLEAIKAVGITKVKQLLDAGATPDLRFALSQKTKVPLDAIDELVKLSDLCRISDIKGVRTRLLFDTGFDTIEKIAVQDSEEMQAQIRKINERENITTRHPTLIETKFWVEQAKNISKLIEY
jgi:hypothetical protein